MRKLSTKELSTISGGANWGWFKCFMTSVACSNSGDALTCRSYQMNCQ